MASASWVAESEAIVETDVGQINGPTTVTNHDTGSEKSMALRHDSPTWLLILLSVATLPEVVSSWAVSRAHKGRFF